VCDVAQSREGRARRSAIREIDAEKLCVGLEIWSAARQRSDTPHGLRGQVLHEIPTDDAEAASDQRMRLCGRSLIHAHAFRKHQPREQSSRAELIIRYC